MSHTDPMSYRNDASITVQDNEENYGTATATKTVYVTDVLPTVTLVKSVDVPTMPEPGGVFNFTLTITNNSVEGVIISDLTDTMYESSDFSECCASRLTTTVSTVVIPYPVGEPLPAPTQ